MQSNHFHAVTTPDNPLTDCLINKKNYSASFFQMSLLNSKKPELPRFGSPGTRTLLPPLVLPPIDNAHDDTRNFSMASTMASALPSAAIPTGNMSLPSHRSSSSASTLPNIASLIHPDPLYSDYLPEKPVELNEKEKPSKKRKKKECPQCHKLVSNLATHKSTHISTDEKPFNCHECGRGFTRLNDLSRHERRHLKNNFFESEDAAEPASSSKTTIFKCPYWDHDFVTQKKNFPGALCKNGKCHVSGVFSRGDTFKNHLRALHFVYPEGTKKRNRQFVPGHCKSCGCPFENVDTWLKSHVLTHECAGASGECAFSVAGFQ